MFLCLLKILQVNGQFWQGYGMVCPFIRRHTVSGCLSFACLSFVMLAAMDAQCLDPLSH